FDQIQFANGSQAIAGDGRGQTIAVITAYADTHIASDVDTFDRTFGINPDNPSQSLYSQYGPSSSFLTVLQQYSRQASNAGWALETALDVEWAHSIAPGAKILLLEAASSRLTDLMSAVNFAKTQPGVVAVTMSWGAGEFAGQTASNLDGAFVT